MAEDFTDGTGDKPVSWWYFEESASPFLDGNTTNNNDLTWSTGTTSTTDIVQGTRSYSISVQDNSNCAGATFASLSANFPFVATTTAFTIGGWVKWPGGGLSLIMASHFSGSTGWRFGLSDGTTGKLSAQLAAAGQLESDSAYPTSGWHHVVLRWNGDNRSGAGANDELSFWVDGVKQSTTQSPADVQEVTTPRLMFNGHASFAPVLYDEWFAFDVAILDTAIADIYAHGLDGTLNPPASRPMFRGS